MTRPRVAVAAGLALFVLYVGTAARDVTFWDAGEFLAAFHTLGIPHPPGTPLFVLLGRVATLALAPLGPVLPGSLLSAATTAAAGALTAWLVERWTASAPAAFAAAIAAGTMSTVWLDATETEVYAPSLALSITMLVAAERASTDDVRPERWTRLIALLFGLAVPLHLSALIAAPPVVLLAATRGGRRFDVALALRLTGLAILAAGVGRMSVATVGVGALVVVAAGAHERRYGESAAECALLALGTSALLVLLVRARMDPALNQGNPATWTALADVVARRQYAVAPLWPRQAPWWLQLANVGEWADWQIALGLHGAVEPSLRRTPLTLLFVLLGGAGLASLARSKQRALLATSALLVASTIGVVAYLNLKAGPSFGIGVLPAGAMHEARERDYFFALGFWTWGALAGVGAVYAATRLMRRPRIGVAIAAIPVATNWGGVTRLHEPDASLPRGLATALLATVPSNGVYLAIGDNDSYPVWFLQRAEGARPDVTAVTIPLLGAPWYRGELSRRHGLLPDTASARWLGLDATVKLIARRAAARGRGVVVSAGITDSNRIVLGGRWTRVGTGWWWDVDAPMYSSAVDSAATRAVARSIAPLLLAPVRHGGDGVAEWAQTLLRCASPDAVASLDARCNSK